MTHGDIEHLADDQQRLVHGATASLIREFDGALSPRVVAECVDDTLARLTSTATVGAYLPLLTERFARDRLRARVETLAVTLGTVVR